MFKFVLDEIHLYDVDNLLFYFLFNAHRHTQLTPLEIPCPGNHQHVVFWFHSCSPLLWLTSFQICAWWNPPIWFWQPSFLFLFNAHRHTQLTTFRIPRPGNHQHVVLFIPWVFPFTSAYIFSNGARWNPPIWFWQPSFLCLF